MLSTLKIKIVLGFVLGLVLFIQTSSAAPSEDTITTTTEVVLQTTSFDFKRAKQLVPVETTEKIQTDKNEMSLPSTVNSSSNSKSNLIQAPKLDLENVDTFGDDDILNNDLATYVAPLDLRKQFPYFLAGYDENKSPIIVAEFGHMDIRSLVERGKEAQDEFLKYCKQISYNCFQLMKNQSTEEHPVNEMSYLIDFEGFQFRQTASVPTLSFLLKLIASFSKLIEEHTSVIYIINANYVVNQVMNFVKPVLGPVSSKLEVFGTTKAKWLPVIRRAFGEHNLPDWYGGKKTYKPLKIFG